MQVKWAQASSEHEAGGVSRELVPGGLGRHARHTRDGEVDELQLMFHGSKFCTYPERSS